MQRYFFSPPPPPPLPPLPSRPRRLVYQVNRSTSRPSATYDAPGPKSLAWSRSMSSMKSDMSSWPGRPYRHMRTLHPSSHPRHPLHTARAVHPSETRPPACPETHTTSTACIDCVGGVYQFSPYLYTRTVVLLRPVRPVFNHQWRPRRRRLLSLGPNGTLHIERFHPATNKKLATANPTKAGSVLRWLDVALHTIIHAWQPEYGGTTGLSSQAAVRPKHKKIHMPCHLPPEGCRATQPHEIICCALTFAHYPPLG